MENSEDPIENDKYTQEKLDKVLEERELKTQWRKDIEQNEAMQNYFKSFSENSVKDFIKTYIRTKYVWMRFGDFYKKMGEKAASKWINLAHDHLAAILQKKLFDLQCLWRAEQIQLEGVEICFDFKVWQEDIWSCPFIEPITSAEVAMYSDYITKTDVELPYYSFDDDWQNYEEIKKAYHDSSEYIDMPEWYEYHNTRTGNNSLMLLPDIRGDKEGFYDKIYFNSKEYLDQIAESDAKLATNPDYDARPYLSTYPKEKLDFFVNTFDDRTAQLKYKYYYENCKYASDDGQTQRYDELFREMLDINEPIPIQAHHDFREAMHKAFNNYKCRKIAENLPRAFEQYLFNKKMGFLVSEKDNHYRESRAYIAKRFIKSRVMNGEAPNLDF